MKWLLSFLFCFSVLFAQAIDRQKLIGQWNFNNLNYIKVYQYVEQEALATLKEKMSKKHSAAALGSYLNLRQDSTFIMIQKDGSQADTLSGVWDVNIYNNHNYLVLKTKEYARKKIRIKSLNDLELVMIFQSKETIYESHWYYSY